MAIKGDIVAAAAVAALNIALNLPLFEPGEARYRDSIEGGYASMARFWWRHPHPWGWNRTEYGGLPSQFTYLPGISYVAGIAARLAPVAEPYHVYRVVAATFACLAPAALFVFVSYFTRSRPWALAAAVAYTFFSPAYGLISTIDKDRGAVYLPWRLQVLVKYGEGPHNAGLVLMLLALPAMWAAATRGGFSRILLAAVLLAAITLTNWVAALATAFCCLMLMLTLAGTSRQTGFQLRRVAAAGVLGYLLACFWLTPTFVKTIASNWPADAFSYQLQRQQQWLLCGLAASLLIIRLLFAIFFRTRRYLCFTVLSLFGFAWLVVWFYSFGLNVIPEARRYTLEFEVLLLAALCEYLRLMWASSNSSARVAAVFPALILAIDGYPQAASYLGQGFAGRHRFPKENAIEYRIAKRLDELRPRGRVFASGGLRFRLNSWFDFEQVGGVFESGLTTRQVLALAYCAQTARCWGRTADTDNTIAVLKALGVEYLVVHGPKSREHYRDFQRREFTAVLDTLHHEEDDTIYRVPFSSLAHLLYPHERAARVAQQIEVQQYAAALGDGLRPKLHAAWTGPSTLVVEGPVPAGMLVSVQVRAEEGWTAFQDTRPLRVDMDAIGWILLRPFPSNQARIVLEYRGTAEQRIMGAISALTWIAALSAWLWGNRVSLSSPAPFRYGE